MPRIYDHYCRAQIGAGSSVIGGAQLVDENGVIYGVKQINGKPRVSAMPYTYDIAEGNVTDHRAWSKIGFKTGLTTEQDIAPWATGMYVFPTGALTMTIVSASGDDTAEGTGARTVVVYYLTTSFIEKNVTVTLNGATPVEIATDIYRVQNARVATAGSGMAAAGNITIASGGTTYGFISATRTRMRQCVWTVPAGKTLYITTIGFSCVVAASKYARFTTRANYDNLSGSILQRGLFMPFNEVLLSSQAYIRDLVTPTKLPATTDLKVSCFADASSTVTCSLGGWLENS